MKNKLFLLCLIFSIFFISCSNIAQESKDVIKPSVPESEIEKTGTTEVKMFVPDYYLIGENHNNTRIIAPQTDRVRLSYKENSSGSEKWFEVSTIALSSAKKETVANAPNNFPGKVYTFTFNGLDLGSYPEGDLKVELIDKSGVLITSGTNSTAVTISKGSKASTSFYTLPSVTNGGKGSLKSGEMKFVPIAVVEGIDCSFKVNTNSDYPDVVLFSELGQLEQYFAIDNDAASSISFKPTKTEICYLGIWADDGNEIPNYSVEFNTNGGTVLKNAVLSGTDLHWEKAKSPYYINQNTLVDDTSSLVIDPGVQVIVTGPYYIKITGSISASGTSENPIIFMRSIDNMSYWEGIQLNSKTVLETSPENNYISGNIFKNCTFVSANIPLSSDTAVYVNNCSFSGNKEAVEVNGNNSIVSDNIFKNGITTSSSWSFRLQLLNNKIYKKSRANGTVKNNDFINCSIEGLYDTAENTVYSNNNFNNCTFDNFSDNSCVITNNNFNNCRSPIFHTNRNFSADYNYNIKNNYWGAENTAELKDSATSQNKNMSFINDYYDDFNLMRFDYSGWVEKPFDNCGYIGSTK